MKRWHLVDNSLPDPAQNNGRDRSLLVHPVNYRSEFVPAILSTVFSLNRSSLGSFLVYTRFGSSHFAEVSRFTTGHWDRKSVPNLIPSYLCCPPRSTQFVLHLFSAILYIPPLSCIIFLLWHDLDLKANEPDYSAKD